MYVSECFVKMNLTKCTSRCLKNVGINPEELKAIIEDTICTDDNTML